MYIFHGYRSFSSWSDQELFSALLYTWLHLLDSNKMLGEKARWELHKDAACYFELSFKKNMQNMLGIT